MGKPKRRVVKKWINRYITPEIKDLPRTMERVNYIPHPSVPLTDKHVQIIARNHTIINGHIFSEGGYRRYYQSNKLKSIKDTAIAIQYIKFRHTHVLLRERPNYRYGRIRLRLITD